MHSCFVSKLVPTNVMRGYLKEVKVDGLTVMVETTYVV